MTGIPRLRIGSLTSAPSSAWTRQPLRWNASINVSAFSMSSAVGVWKKGDLFPAQQGRQRLHALIQVRRETGKRTGLHGAADGSALLRAFQGGPHQCDDAGP